MLYFVLAAVLVAADQLVKYLVSANIPLGGSVPFLPHIMDLTYVQNTGCAFSLLEEHTWLLTAVSAIMSVVLVVALVRDFFKHPLGKTVLSLVLAGAVGNLIDRALFGYVIDMFRTLFMNFAVFNVADIFVVVGGFAAALYYLFLEPKLEHPAQPQEENHDKTDADC